MKLTNFNLSNKIKDIFVIILIYKDLQHYSKVTWITPKNRGNFNMQYIKNLVNIFNI